MNSFMVWAQQARNIYTKKYPELLNSEISKILGAEWKVMTPEEKNIWKYKADSINEVFKQQNPNYVYTPKRENYKKDTKDTKDSNSFPIQLPYKEGLVILFNGAESPDVVDSTIIDNLYIFLCDGSSSIIPDTPYYEDPDMENMFSQSDNIFIQLGELRVNSGAVLDCSFNPVYYNNELN